MPDAPIADIELAEAIYDGLRQPPLIHDVMSRFARVMGCDAAYLKIVDQEAGQVLIGVGGGAPEGSDRDYLENYLETDVRVPRVNRAARCTILDDRQLMSADELRQSAFHHEFLPRYDLGYLAHVNLARSPRFTTIVTCAQASRRGEFSEEQIGTLATYIPHFEQSCDLYLRLRELGGYAALMAATFDSLPSAGLVLDAGAGVIFLNALARDILADRDGLIIRDGRLEATDLGAARVLRAALARASGQGLVIPMNEGSMSIIGRPSGRPGYRLEARPLPLSSGFRQETTAALVFVLIHDPVRMARTAERRLRRQYGLTPAETALALAVASGAALRDYADERGVTVGTVRFQMKQVLAKTECRRQADLVRLVSGGGISFSA
ncbi:MAG: helix-turn-helix transcriptional regulator [Rhodospirillales bacterium]